MRVLVTGGAGFIGSHVVDLLAASGHDVAVLDRAPPRPGSGARWIEGDVRDAQAWSEALEGVDAVSHQAARVGLGVDFGDVTAYVDDNDAGTAAGLQVLHGRGFPGRVVLAGSMVVYGEGRYRCPRHGAVRAGPRAAARLDAGRFEPPCPACGADLVPEAVDEDAAVDPRNVYAATKLHQEHLLAAYVREHTGASALSLRYHNVYGPRMPVGTPYAGVAAIFRSALLSGRPPQVFEDGGQTRDFVHVADVARANLAALAAPVEGFAAFNVCSGKPRTVGELATLMWKAMDAGAGCEPEVTGRWRAGDVRHVFASPERAAGGLGFRAEVDLEDGIPSLLDG